MSSGRFYRIWEPGCRFYGTDGYRKFILSSPFSISWSLLHVLVLLPLLLPLKSPEHLPHQSFPSLHLETTQA